MVVFYLISYIIYIIYIHIYHIYITYIYHIYIYMCAYHCSPWPTQPALARVRCGGTISWVVPGRWFFRQVYPYDSSTIVRWDSVFIWIVSLRLDWLDGPMSQQSGSSLIYLQKKTRSFPLMGLWWESIRGIRECPSMVILWWYFLGILWLLGGDWNHHGILMNFMWLSRNSWEESSFQLTVQRGRYTTNQIVFWYELFH